MNNNFNKMYVWKNVGRDKNTPRIIEKFFNNEFGIRIVCQEITSISKEENNIIFYVHDEDIQKIETKKEIIEWHNGGYIVEETI